ncbi:MAG: hypothetical protein AABX74_01410 [Nanoarchaeota archaeon]
MRLLDILRPKKILKKPQNEVGSLSELEKLLDRHSLHTAKKIIAVEEIPTWGELVRFFNDLEDEEIKTRYSRKVLSGESFNITEGTINQYFTRKDGWDRFCYDEHIYHAFCYEFVEKLAEEIKGLECHGSTVEVFAGNGKLSHWLREFGVPSIATDNYSWEIRRNPKDVINLSHLQALEKYKPELVIGCWVPGRGFLGPENDVEVLNFPSVRYYLRIGLVGSDEISIQSSTSIPYNYLDSANRFSFSERNPITGQVQNSFAALFTKPT